MVRLHFDHSNLGWLSLIDKAVNCQCFFPGFSEISEKQELDYFTVRLLGREGDFTQMGLRYCHCLWSLWISSALLGHSKGCCEVHEVFTGLYWDFQNVLDYGKPQVASCHAVYQADDFKEHKIPELKEYMDIHITPRLVYPLLIHET